MKNLIIEIPSKSLTIQVNPYVSNSSWSEFIDFPKVDFNIDTSPIVHTTELTIPFEKISVEMELTEEIEAEIRKNYYVENVEHDLKIVVARLRITEFPTEWKERIGVSWMEWLDAYDGDHLVVGERAENKDTYDDSLLFGSLFYIERVDVHPKFRGHKLGMDLISHSLWYLSRSGSGPVFLIAQPMKSVLCEEDKEYKDTKKLVNYYRKLGFTEIRKLDSEAYLMETRLGDFRENEFERSEIL
jgi:GNAT superfamily N-acetyltransferase